MLSKSETFMNLNISMRTPSKDLTSLFVNELVKSIVVEEDEEAQYEMFDALYAWAWFPTNEDYYEPLIANLDNLLCVACLGMALEVLIASGSAKYREIYTKYSFSEFVGIREIAEKGLENY